MDAFLRILGDLVDSETNSVRSHERSQQRAEERANWYLAQRNAAFLNQMAAGVYSALKSVLLPDSQVPDHQAAYTLVASVDGHSPLTLDVNTVLQSNIIQDMLELFSSSQIQLLRQLLMQR